MFLYLQPPLVFPRLSSSYLIQDAPSSYYIIVALFAHPFILLGMACS